jgi:hypothetical protein
MRTFGLLDRAPILLDDADPTVGFHARGPHRSFLHARSCDWLLEPQHVTAVSPLRHKLGKLRVFGRFF